MNWPGQLDRRLLLLALSSVTGTIGTLALHPWIGVGAALGVAVGRLPAWVRWTVPLGLVVGTLSGVVGLAEQRTVAALEIESGRSEVVITLRTDPREGRFGWSALADTEDGAPLLLSFDTTPGLVAGERALIEGTIVSGLGSYRGEVYVGRLLPERTERLGSAPGFEVANRLRDRVREELEPYDQPGAALVSGFLIGDISRLPDLHREDLTAAGISHFVAVSGSNVVMALGLWWVVTAPLAISPRTRALTGVIGVALFVLVTRWEPSVLRAGAMVTLVLVARSVGVPLSGWGSLSLATIGLILFDPHLALSIGFQLSAAATGGLLAGSSVLDGRVPRWLSSPLGATLSAQAAVAPLLLLHFGTVPVMSPLANLLAAPVVALSTSLGGIGVLTGLTPLTTIAVGLGQLVIRGAAIAATWPSVGWVGFVGLTVAAAALSRRRTRLVGGVGLLIWVTGVATGVASMGPSVTVLDVGQGDAILLTGAGGERILVDGGPDPRVLAARLRSHDVRALDLLVISHRHADHVAGLEAVLGILPVAEVWWAPHDELGAMAETLQRIESNAIPLRAPRAGERYTIGSIEVEVLGPRRRYASPNDASLVFIATINGHRIGMVGDIETYAQADLGPIDVDVLKVPHQGAATSLESWLTRSAGQVSVISVGPNDYGHPSEWVMDALADGGAQVCRTDEDGDVTVELGYSSVSLSGC